MTILLIGALLAAGCGRGEEDAGPEAAPPDAALVAISGAQLAEALELLDRELARAIDAGVGGDEGLRHFTTAEAITDRLLETQYPFTWLKSESYSVDARLRQIQALADRITAAVRSAAPTDSVTVDLRRLRQDVVQLRRALAQGGGPVPVPLERLLAGRDTLDLSGGEGAGGE